MLFAMTAIRLFFSALNWYRGIDSCWVHVLVVFPFVWTSSRELAHLTRRYSQATSQFVERLQAPSQVWRPGGCRFYSSFKLRHGTGGNGMTAWGGVVVKREREKCLLFHRRDVLNITCPALKTWVTGQPHGWQTPGKPLLPLFSLEQETSVVLPLLQEGMVQWS